MEKLLIRGSVTIDPVTGLQKKQDILLSGGKIKAIAAKINFDSAHVIDANGMFCAPGLVDMHVHLRDPGQTYKEDIFSGCCAAAAGGVTSIACMPNTKPTCDNMEVITDIILRSSSACSHVYPVGAVSNCLGGNTLTDFAELKAAGAVAVSDDGHPVSTAGLMFDALYLANKNGIKVLSHCEELSLVRSGIMNDGVVSNDMCVPGIHRAAEDVGIARDITIAEAAGLPVHICHVSTRGGVSLIRDAKRRGVKVTAETAPHYFSLTEDFLKKRDADYRMNPPLRTQDDVEAVIEGLKDGTISAIATDHAPHSTEDKTDFLTAPNGVIGLETSLAVGITYLVKPGHISLPDLLALMSTQPARILGIPAGTLDVGATADLMIFDPNEKWTVLPNELHSKSKNTPFKGMTLQGRVKITILEGRIVYNDPKII